MISIPITNPIRFQEISTVIDYSDVMPTSDNMRLGIEYQRGVFPVNFNPIFLKSKEISIEFYSSTLLDTAGLVKVMAPDGLENPTVTNITNPSWVGDYVYKASYEPIIDGEHYFIINSEYVSDKFLVRSAKNDCVKMQWYDNQNRYGAYYTDGVDYEWQPIAYYNGVLLVDKPEDDQSVYDQANGNTTTLQADPKRIRKLIITDIDVNYIDVIKLQVVCSNLYVNGLRFAATDFDVSLIDKSNICNITIKLTLKDNDYNFMY